MSLVYYHGGVAGLNAGDMLVPSPAAAPCADAGCPACVARREGRACTVGEFRAWARTRGPRGVQILDALGGAADHESFDPPPAVEAVYITTDMDYGLWYAARSRGDLYRVQPVGEVVPSVEDHFPSFTVASARVVEVIRRGVQLDRAARRRISRRWEKADRRALANAGGRDA